MKDKLPKFFAAVDDSAEKGAVEKIDLIKDVDGNFGIKINLDLVFGDLQVIRRVKERINKPLFVDTKMWNGKRTMAEVVKKLTDLGVEMTNIYAHAGNMAKESIKIANDNNMAILGLTVLTHYDDKYCDRVYGKSMADTVKVLTEIALENGCHGVILPGTTLEAVANFNCIKFNPGTRPAWFEDKKANAQEQIMAPGEAIKKVTNGKAIVSCGSPIFKSPDPAKALKLILEEINSV